MDLFNDFSGEEYQGEQDNYPWVQLITKDEIERSGLFISTETAARVGFKPDATWAPFKTTFKGAKEPTPGFLCQTPRLIILARSRSTIWKQKSNEFVGINVKGHKLYDRDQHILKTRYLLWIVGDKNQSLINAPLQFTTKGAFNGSFGAALGDYQAAVNSLMVQHSKDKKPRNAKFFSMLVTEVKVKLEARGKEETLCCVVDKITPPTIDNIRSLFLGTDPALKELFESYHEGAKKFVSDFEGGGTVEDKGDGGWDVDGGDCTPVDASDIEILPPTALSEEGLRTKCLEIIKALGFDKDNGRQAITLLNSTVGIASLSTMNRQQKERVLLALYGLITASAQPDF